MKLTDRSTGDLLVIIIAGTICASVLLAGAGITIIEIRNPKTDTSQAISGVSDVINTLIGLLAGFLAGRTEYSRTRKPDKDDKMDNE